MSGRRSAAPGAGGKAALSVGFILTNNFTLTALSNFLDALRLAADDGDGSRPIRCHWQIVGAKRTPVPSSCGVAITPDATFGDPGAFDYIVVVGGLLHRGPQIDAATLGFLHAAASAGVPLIGVCTGSFVLCRAGLMRDRKCCVSWYHHRDFIEEFPDIVPIADQLYIVDRDRITCSGGAGVVDLAAFLIERHLGPAIAQKAMHILQIDQARPANQAQPQPAMAGDLDNNRVRRAALLMEQHINEPLAIEEIARRLSVSARQLERIFLAATGLSPTRFYRQLRLRYAMWRLRSTARTVTAIAQEAGFADCAHFSRQFREFFGVNPSSIRREDSADEAMAPAASRFFRE
jgi:transcriptional regulator GlxA family with amidase domain